MRNATLWQRLLGVGRIVIEGVEIDDDVGVVVSVRPPKRARQRCGRCGRRAPAYDRGDGRRRWRHLDVGEMRCMLEADAPRVNCAAHGPTVVQVPWARHDVGHTRPFDDQVAWLAVHTSKSAVCELMRVAWRTVGAIVTRVVSDARGASDPFDGLARIGIDEISYKCGHRYLTIVVDHDSGRLIWAAPGRDERTLAAFFDLLGAQRCAQLTHISADSAEWIERVVTDRCPNAIRCADAFHIVAWATAALDEVRRQAWNDARALARAEGSPRRGRPRAGVAQPQGRDRARRINRARHALWKNPDDLTDHQRAKLEWIAKTDPRLHRAYLLKEGLRLVFALKGDAGKDALDRWSSWARRSRIPAFVELQRRIRKHRAAIDATLDGGPSNALVESTNTKIRLLTRIAYGFHSAEPLIALAMLDRGGYRPHLPHA